ncbi:MAG TPA: fructosamine kinase family protein [Pseudonocardiaceae bacterium]
MGVDAVDAHRIGGGSTSAIFEVELADGDVVVAKALAAELPGATDAEVAGLRWLAEPAVAAVPAVRGHDDLWLVLDYVEPGHPTPDAAERLGRELAALHASGAPAHGAPPTGGPVRAWIGRAPMHNATTTGWPEFYAEHRVRPYLRRATASGVLDQAEATVVARAADAIPEVAGPAEPPARLHGDLWSGNVQYGRNGRAWLLDPAAHGGHRETDLAMLALFGAPHLDRVLAAYHEVAPLPDGWAERVPLHQLFPLLVHAVLFGRSYAGQAVRAARDVLALRR